MRVAAGMDRSLAEIRAKTAGLPHPATLLVFERDPASLRNVYASGGYGFLHDMLEIAGGRNVFADVKQQAVQASTEMLIASKPEVIVELRYGDSLKNADIADGAARLGRAGVGAGRPVAPHLRADRRRIRRARSARRRRDAQAGRRPCIPDCFK